MGIKSSKTLATATLIAFAMIETALAADVNVEENVKQLVKIQDVVSVANGSILVVPFTTELQRLASPSYEGADYLIEVNGRELLGNNPNPSRKQAEEFDYRPIAKELREIEGFKDAKVVVRVLWPSAANLVNGLICQAHLWQKVNEVCKEAVRSEQQVVVFDTLDKTTWQKEVAALSKKPSQEEIRQELAKSDGQVSAYQPRTPLSRFLYQDADCVVHLVPPLLDAKFSAIVNMERAVSQLNLKQKCRVTFLFSPGRQPVEEEILMDEFFGARVWKQRLGFSDWCRLKRI